MSCTRTAGFSGSGWLAVLVVASAIAAASGCQRDAAAQVPYDPLGPIHCYQLATSAELSSNQAVQLCAAALTDAPGRCYAVAVDQFRELASQKIQQLCHAATSLEPLACYARLDALGTLTEDQIVSYCTTACSLGPPPAQVASSACLDAAVRYTNLSLQSAGELCQASRSAGPVQCYLAGVDLHYLADNTLVQLCAEARRCQYTYY
jgi:hypothetical protein